MQGLTAAQRQLSNQQRKPGLRDRQGTSDVPGAPRSAGLIVQAVWPLARATSCKNGANSDWIGANPQDVASPCRAAAPRASPKTLKEMYPFRKFQPVFRPLFRRQQLWLAWQSLRKVPMRQAVLSGEASKPSAQLLPDRA